MDEYIETCLVDVLNACTEVEMFFADQPRIFERFKTDMLRVRAGYDSVTPEFLWSLVINHIPALKDDIEAILRNK